MLSKQDWPVHKTTVCVADNPRVIQLIEAITDNDSAVVEELAAIQSVFNGKVTSYNLPGLSRPLTKWTPLHECARIAYHHLLLKLLQHNHKLEIKDGDGETPLFIAAGARTLDVTRALLNDGANPNAKGKDGWSALMMATRNCDLETVRALLDSHVDVYGGHDMFGRTAWDLAHTLASGQAIGVRESETYDEVLQRAQQLPAMYEAYLGAE